VGAEAALAEEPGDPAIVLAVIDSGVSLRHPELRGRLRPGADTVDLPEDHLSPTIHLLGDHTRRDRDPQDEQGHGTACAGLLAARGLGVPRGLAGGCRILPMRALAGARSPGRAAPTAIGAIADLDAAVKLAVDLGARVLNLSFGTPASALREDDPVPHVEVVQYALSRGCVLVAASGNAGDDGLYYPAALPGVIAVGAVDDSERPTSFTSYGPHLALCAPGRDLPTLAIDGYRRSTGTSFAAPFVSAAAALLLSRAARSAAAVDPLQIRRILMESAAPFSAPAEGFGGGVLRIPSALSQLADELSVREVA
jgi:subtilisin family serine protease